MILIRGGLSGLLCLVLDISSGAGEGGPYVYFLRIDIRHVVIAGVVIEINCTITYVDPIIICFIGG